MLWFEYSIRHMNPHAIHIYTDGASDYNTQQTGGIGFCIEFPDHTGLEPLEGSFNINNHGIHKLEMLGLIHAMERILIWHKENQTVARSITGGVIFHTDRHSIIDTELTNPYTIDGWRRNGWKRHDNTPVKHHDLLDQIDKKRKKIASSFGGKIEIIYTREKHNKKADKLSKNAKHTLLRSSKTLPARKVKTGKRLHAGPEVDYTQLDEGDRLVIFCYLKVAVQDEHEVFFDICDGNFLGCKVRSYLKYKTESKIHRHHFYGVTVEQVKKHSIVFSDVFNDVTDSFKNGM